MSRVPRTYERCLAALHEANGRCRPPLAARQVENVARSIWGKDGTNHGSTDRVPLADSPLAEWTAVRLGR